MAREMRRIDISDMPELLRIAEEVRSTNESRVLQRENEDIAILMPARRSKRVPAGRPLTYDDPLWKLVGSAQLQGPTDVSENKYKYPAEAYLPDEA